MRSVDDLARGHIHIFFNDQPHQFPFEGTGLSIDSPRAELVAYLAQQLKVQPSVFSNWRIEPNVTVNVVVLTPPASFG